MKTRITALLLALVMAVCCLTGCTSTRVRSYSEESSDASTDKYAAALDAYKSNKKVMTINGSPVYWNQDVEDSTDIPANVKKYRGGGKKLHFTRTGSLYCAYIRKGLIRRRYTASAPSCRPRNKRAG